MIEQVDSSLFDWQTWRAGSLFDIFGIAHRTWSIWENRGIIIRHAIGWAHGECIPCRPKINYIAVMFAVEDRIFWTHLLKCEFENIFNAP